MKNKIFNLATIIILAGTMLTGCVSSNEKTESDIDRVQDAKEKTEVAVQALNRAIQDSIQQFKKESQEKINNYEKHIAELNAKIAHEKKGIKAEYEKKLALMKQKNQDLNKKLVDFKANEHDKWIAFKEEFNLDMEELGKSFKDFTVDN